MKSDYKSNERTINEILSEHFVWYMENSMKEFQMFYQFWEPKVTTPTTYGR